MTTLNTPNFAAPSSHGRPSSPPQSQTSSPISPKSTNHAFPSISTNLSNNPPPPRLTTTSSQQFPSSKQDDDDISDDDDVSNLPFPTALPRPSFLTPHFSPLAYLDSLYASSSSSPDPTNTTANATVVTTITPFSQRHQTLPDLRSELHTRSLAISSELLELVNANYTSFLSLGDELKGGEERVEDVRVAVLGFRRAVEEVRGKVREKRGEIGDLVKELGYVRGGVEWGRGVLELGERVEGLEVKLNMGSLGSTGGSGGGAGVEAWVKKGTINAEEDREEDEYEGWDDGSEDFKEEVLDDDGEGDEEREGFVASSPAELEALAREYVKIEQMADRLGGHEVPFVRKMEERMIRCRNTILLDLSTALKEARRAGERGKKRVVRYLGVYRLLDAEQEAVRVLKEK
ncbi:oligomeric golgi complex component, COG2-domain-containing protein [Neurospora crassa]|nr:oligomeric golgi complex component, COG2-domain-containing protein [Neurospora crassa]